MPTHKQKPIPKADAARKKGVTRGAVTLACRPGHALHASLLPNGRIDSGHAAYLAWLGQETETDAAPTQPDPSRPDDVRDFLELRLKEINEHWATVTGAADYLALQKTATDIALKQQQLWRNEGLLISRAIVSMKVFGYFEELHKRLLLDATKTLASRIRDAANAHENLEHCEKIAREYFTSLLARGTKRIAAGLRAAQVPGNTQLPEEPEEL
jgi:hypothetical protein